MPLPATRPMGADIVHGIIGDADIHRALEAGAKSYLLKDSMYRELIDAIRSIDVGKGYISPAAAAEIAGHALDSALTTRELMVLRLMANGNRNKEIAASLTSAKTPLNFMSRASSANSAYMTELMP